MWFFFLYYIGRMDFFDQSYQSIQKAYKPNYKQKANTFALWFVSSFQVGLLLLVGIFLYLFLNEMRTITLSADKAWLIFTVFSIVLIVRNWLRYSGRALKIRNAKKNTVTSSSVFKVWQLVLTLIALYIVSFMILLTN